MDIVSPEFERQNVKMTNRRLVLSEVILNGPVDRTNISQRTSLTISSVSRISRDLIAAGLVVEGESLPSPGRAGRRVVEIEVNPSGGYVLGVSINAFQQFITLADLKNRPIVRRELDLKSISDAPDVLSKVAAAANEMIVDSGIPRNRLFGGSIAVAGAIDSEKGIVRLAPTLDWRDVHVGDYLSGALGIPIHVENLPAAMILAETRFGIGRGYKNVVLLNAALGIAGSLLLDNQVIRGHDFSAGLLGSLPLYRNSEGRGSSVDETAGGRGVLSNLHGKTAVKSLSPLAPLVIDAMKTAEEGDKDAISALLNAGRCLADVVETITCIVHPRLFIISGPLASSQPYIGGLHARLVEIWPDNNDSVHVKVGKMTSQAAARWLAINEFLLRRDMDIEELMESNAA